ncbi:MAG: TolC family protein [Pseudomonadota bacterium]
MPLNVAPLLTIIALSGCATFSEDGGFDSVREQSRSLADLTPTWIRSDEDRAQANSRVSVLLGQELTVGNAVDIALLNNPRLQVEYASLGLREADLVQAGRLPNPGFTFSKTSGGGAQEIERGLHFNILALLTMPIRSRIEHRRFEATKLSAVAATIEVANEARTAFIEAVAAQQIASYFEQVAEAADASRTLMLRMHRVGNASRLSLAREQLFHAESLAGLARAQMSVDRARERLIRSLGLWGEQTQFRLPDRLPELPEAPQTLTNIEATALAQRVDVRTARRQLDALSENLGLAKGTRFINVLEGGPVQVRDRGEPKRNGYEVSLEIPIFDFGGARIARAQALYTQASEQLRSAAINARSEVRDAYRGYRTAFDLAKHYRDEIVPLRKQISDEQLLRYNGMLLGVFELIADAREQVVSVSAYIDALRTFWLADANLQTALISGNATSPIAMALGMPSAGANSEAH